MTTLPTLFLSHGSPMTALLKTPAQDFLKGLSGLVPRPRAILVVTAHWLTRAPAVSATEQPPMIYDFGGFPQALFNMVYPAPGDPALAQRVAQLLGDAGFPTSVDPVRGFDHGTWVPLILAYPEATIPVVQLSVQPRETPAHHIAIGRALAPLADEGVLVVGSGSFTHNLYELDRENEDGPVAPWVAGFVEWMVAALERGDEAALQDYRRLAPDAVRNHPTDEHLLPLYVALGAAGPHWHSDRLHRSVEYSSLAMDAFAFRTAA
jgi:4,5-DOPA dioxygenase extradiol